MSALDILDSAVSNNGTISNINLFELDKYEVQPTKAQDTKVPSTVPDNNSSQDSAVPSGGLSSDTSIQAPEPEAVSVDSMAYTELADVIMSRILVFGCHIIDKKASVNDFKLQADEKKKLAPLVGKVVEKYLLTMSVEMQLAIMALAMYGGRFLMIASDDDRDLKATKKKAVKSSATIDEAGEVKRGRGRPPKN